MTRDPKPKRPPVVLLCGGQGMRLREVSEKIPKAMVEVGGRPIIWHIMRNYAAHGYTRFIVCLGHLGNVIRDYFLEYPYTHNDFTVTLKTGASEVTIHPSSHPDAFDVDGWEVTLAETGPRTMTGARIKRIEHYIDTDYFLCTYGDGLANVDIGALVAFHQSHGKLTTLTGVRPANRFGIMVVDGDQVSAFSEKPPQRDPVNGGFFVFDRKVFQYLSSTPDCVLEQGPFSAIASEGQMVTYSHAGFWQCVDTPRDLEELNDEWYAAIRGSRNPRWFA